MLPNPLMSSSRRLDRKRRSSLRHAIVTPATTSSILSIHPALVKLMVPGNPPKVFEIEIECEHAKPDSPSLWPRRAPAFGGGGLAGCPAPRSGFHPMADQAPRRTHAFDPTAPGPSSPRSLRRLGNGVDDFAGATMSAMMRMSDRVMQLGNRNMEEDAHRAKLLEQVACQVRPRPPPRCAAGPPPEGGLAPSNPGVPRTR